MALDDIRITQPSCKPERMSRVTNTQAFRDNFDAIFRKGKRPAQDTEPEENPDENHGQSIS